MFEIFSHYRFIAIIIWLGAVAASLLWNSVDNTREQNVTAYETARAFFEQILATRQWNLTHGGVYVYTTEKSPPNPYLPEKNRTIRDEHGSSLTLINPAYMTRQIAEITNERSQLQFHITSLDPIREANAPLPWEIPWLLSFNEGAREHGAFVKEDTARLFRYMAPLPFNQSCLPCHSPPVNSDNIRGGISITMPAPFKKSPWPLLMSHLLAALTGIGFLFFFGARLAESRRNILRANKELAREIEDRKETENELLSIKENLEVIVGSRTAELQRTNAILDGRIKEQQRVEAALVSINDEFIQIFNSAPDGMHVIDRSHTVSKVNRAFCRLINRKQEEIQGRKCFEVFTGKLCHTAECPLTRISNGEERVEMEVRKNRVDGEPIPCVVTATPFREPGGKLAGIIVVTRDISSWKKIEESLSSTAENLRLRNSELEDFAHVISHDLQEPLMLIQAFSDRIQTKCSTNLPPYGHDYLEQIKNATQRMQDLIDGLLSYSRVSSKAIPFEKVDLNSTIDYVLKNLAIRIEQYQGQVSVDPDLGSIEADPLQMRQLFQNIIGNSLKYHHPQRTPEIQITRELFQDESQNHDYIRIHITDNGIGFDSRHAHKIFDIFQRLHTRKQFKGTGIGLSICKKIVERHQGTISAHGTPGERSVFTVTLPRHHLSPEDEEKNNRKLIENIINRR